MVRPRDLGKGPAEVSPYVYSRLGATLLPSAPVVNAFGLQT